MSFHVVLQYQKKWTQIQARLTRSSLFSMNSSSMLTASILTPMYSLEPCCTFGINSTSKQCRGRLPSRLIVWLKKRGMKLVGLDEIEQRLCNVSCPTCGTPLSSPLPLHGSSDSVSVWLPNVWTPPPLPACHKHTYTHVTLHTCMSHTYRCHNGGLLDGLLLNLLKKNIQVLEYDYWLNWWSWDFFSCGTNRSSFSFMQWNILKNKLAQKFHQRYSRALKDESY